jgi:hypothetical protein
METLRRLLSDFNRGSLDVPANLFTPRTAFTLNNRTYESILGGSPDDPLIRLLARGAAGYRAAARVLLYALQRPVATIESMSAPDESGVVAASVRIEGLLRSGEPFAGLASLRLSFAGPELAAVDVVCREEDLTRIAESRLA